MMCRILHRVVSAVVFLLAIILSVPAASAAIVVRAGFASVSNDPEAGTWTIASSGTSLVLAAGAARDFEIVRLSSSSNTPWTIGAMPDTFLKVGGQTLIFGNRAAGLFYKNVETSVEG